MKVAKLKFEEETSMDAIFSTLNPDSGSKTRLLLAATVLSALALLLAAGWLLWLPEPAQAQDVS